MPLFVRDLYARFLKIRGTPKEISLGMALGLMVGMSPTMGIQTIISVFLASLFKWSKITAAIGVQITNPLSAPFIYGTTYLIGAKLLGLSGGFDIRGILNLDGLMHLLGQAPVILLAMTLGGIAIGLPLAAAGYAATLWITTRYHTPIKENLQVRIDRVRIGRVGQIIRHPRTRKKRRRKK